MMVSCLMCGAGAVGGIMDGWHGVGPQAGLGGGAAGDMELIEYQYPSSSRVRFCEGFG